MTQREAELLEALKALLEWENNMGGWDAHCWTQAQKLVDQYATSGGEDVTS